MNKATKGRLLPGLMRALLWVVFVLVVLVAIPLLVRIPINLNDYRGVVADKASELLDRKVTIDGDVFVTTSLWPVIEMQGLHISNAPGFSGDTLAELKHARVSVGVISALYGRLRIREVKVEGLTLNLELNEAGDANWVLFDASEATAEPVESKPAASGAPQDGKALRADAFAIDVLELHDIDAGYLNAGVGEEQRFHIDQCIGSAGSGEPMHLDLEGSFLNEAYTLGVDANSLAEFLGPQQSRIALTLDIAGTHSKLEGSRSMRNGKYAMDLQVDMEVADLSDLNDLLGIVLPPLTDIQLSTHLTAEPGRAALESLNAVIGDSSLAGKLIITQEAQRPKVQLTLQAKTIQLDDFIVEGYGEAAPAENDTPDESDTTKENDTPEGAAESSAAERPRLYDPEALQRLDVQAEIQIDELLSGDDNLGNGELVLSLEDGRINVEPLRLQAPGGELLVELSVKPGTVKTPGRLRMLLDEFDFSVLARHLRPGTDLGGVFSVDIDLELHSNGFENIFAGANGYIDLLGVPVNFKAGVIDLWAVNLVSSVVSSSVEDDDASVINCMIGRLTMTKGVVLAEQLAIDTSRIRICGKGDIDFNQRDFDLVMAPVAKRAEFFSLATPLAVKGDFSDFGIGPKGGVVAVGTTAVKFAVSPITTPIKRVFKGSLPEDGADMCGLPIGPRTGELEAVVGC